MIGKNFTNDACATLRRCSYQVAEKRPLAGCSKRSRGEGARKSTSGGVHRQ